MIQSALKPGDFVRVKASSDFRPGQDGMVVDAGDGNEIALMFCYDRHGRSPSKLGITCTGLTEAWTVGELDLSSVNTAH